MEIEILDVNLDVMKKKDEIFLSEIGLTAESTVSSLNFARLIQNAILCNRAGVKDIFGDFSILYEPKNILSGDFYFCHQKEGKKYLAVCDCTGHGISGALLSILGHNMLERCLKKYTSVADVLTCLNRHIIESFNTNAGLDSLGMDVIIFSIDEVTNELEYAGARRPLWVMSDNEVNVYKTDKVSVGDEKNYKFHSKKIQLNKKDRVFTFTDGITDQFGGDKSTKLGAKSVKKIIQKSSGYTLQQFSEVLNTLFKQYRGEEIKTDDALFLGVEV